MLAVTMGPDLSNRQTELQDHYPYWEKIGDCIDNFIDVFENYRQSGHPGGSRSKRHMIVTLTLGGFMRWDIRHPEKAFGDRFVLVGGHTIPVIYAMLAAYNTALRAKYERTGDERYAVPEADERQLLWKDLLGFRRRGGLAGHAEMQGKTLFLKFNTGPSGHGSPAAAGEAAALKRAGATGVKVFAVDGEGGLTPGAVHETKNSAWGLGLDNLHYLIDWNDYGIDSMAISDVVPGNPISWFEPYGFRIHGTEHGSEYASVAQTLLETLETPNPDRVPNMTWFKTIKGRGYGITGYKSHGTPHKMNSELFWQGRKEFADKYGVEWHGFGEAAPSDASEQRAQFEANLKVIADAITSDDALVDYLADRLVTIGESVPKEIEGFKLDTSKNPFEDQRFWDHQQYPDDLFVKPGTTIANRAALAKWGAYVNSLGKQEYGRPLFIAMSADLSESTNIAGFADGYDDMPGWGRYDRNHNLDGALLPQQITEFTNSGMCAGIATVNFSPSPYEKFDGFYSSNSTYASFAYLQYGPMRLFSQLAQDSDLKVGKVLWVAGHSGPETAEDSRTHFGIFSPGVTQLFPEGRIINLIPWEYNEVPVLLAAAFSTDASIVALHLTRPPIQIPDRAALGMAPYTEAARGAYLLRDYKPDQPRGGTILVQGTLSTANVVGLLPKLDEEGLNVKLIATVSPELFKRQPQDYQDSILSAADRLDLTYITNGSRRLMRDWITHQIADEYALSADFDNRWRTGGSPVEVYDEAHLSPDHILAGIKRFVGEREQRLAGIASALDAAR